MSYFFTFGIIMWQSYDAYHEKSFQIQYSYFFLIIEVKVFEAEVIRF